MDTVRIEYMLVNSDDSVIINWTTIQGSVQNDPQVYVRRALETKRNMSTHVCPARVRVVSEQTNRIVDIFP
jgi:hypothetical protein